MSIGSHNMYKYITQNVYEQNYFLKLRTPYNRINSIVLKYTHIVNVTTNFHHFGT